MLALGQPDTSADGEDLVTADEAVTEGGDDLLS